MPDPGELLHVRVVDRDGAVLGWLQQPPQNPAWNLGPEASAGAWPRQRAAQLFTDYQHGQAWRGRRPELVPAATRSGDTGGMAGLVSGDGAWRVEPRMLDEGGGPRLRYRITHHGLHVATVSTVEEVAQHVDLTVMRDEDAEDGA